MLQVRTKTVSQCVEFYYLTKKLVDKQKKLKEEECRDGELGLQKSVRKIVWRVFSPPCHILSDIRCAWVHQRLVIFL